MRIQETLRKALDRLDHFFGIPPDTDLSEINNREFLTQFVEEFDRIKKR